MKNTEELFNLLKEKFGDAIIELKKDQPVDPFIIVDPFQIDKISLFLRNNEDLLFDYLVNLAGVDDANEKNVTGENGNQQKITGTLSVFYHLESTKFRHRLILKVSTPKEEPEVSSVESIWKHANWEEREVYDMFGIIFLNHPNLRRILMPYDWEAGYPLRKDYKNPEFYQGMKVSY